MTITMTITYCPRMYTNDTLMFFLPQKTQMNTDIVRAGGSLIEDGAGNVVLQRFPSFAEFCHLKVNFQVTRFCKRHLDAARCISPRLQSINDISDISFFYGYEFRALLIKYLEGFFE